MRGWWVSGIPRPQGSFTIMNRGGRPVPIYPKDVLKFRKAVHDQTLASMGDTPKPWHSKSEKLRVRLRFVVDPFPQAPMGPDIDKLARTVCDGLKGVAYVDDKQIVELIASKERLATQIRKELGTGVYITVEALYGEESPW